jgi:large subunit ribosomal protein L5
MTPAEPQAQQPRPKPAAQAQQAQVKPAALAQPAEKKPVAQAQPVQAKPAAQAQLAQAKQTAQPRPKAGRSKSGKMRVIRVDKAVINIGVGESGDKLVKAQKVLQMLTKRKPVETISKTTNKDLNIRKKQPIGCKVTIRGGEAEEFIRKALWVKDNKIFNYSFDPQGNFSFGIPDYTEFEGMKYDPEIGVFGMDVTVTLSRAGRRVAIRRRAPGRLHPRHRITREEGIEFVKNAFKVEVIE